MTTTKPVREMTPPKEVVWRRVGDHSWGHECPTTGHVSTARPLRSLRGVGRVVSQGRWGQSARRASSGRSRRGRGLALEADQQRVRRVTQRVVDAARGIVERAETIYLDGCEIRRVIRDGEPILERMTSHIRFGDRRVALVHRWTLDADQRETTSLATAKTHYQIGDDLGSATLELDDNGALITYEAYFPFGGSSFVAGRSAREVKLKAYRYSGKLRDDATGLYYYGFRYYAAWIGGWLSPDPIGPADGVNLYRFVWNNPIRLVDADGLRSVWLDVPSHLNRLENTPEMKQALLDHLGEGWRVKWRRVDAQYQWQATYSPVAAAKGLGEALERIVEAARKSTESADGVAGDGGASADDGEPDAPDPTDGAEQADAEALDKEEAGAATVGDGAAAGGADGEAAHANTGAGKGGSGDGTGAGADGTGSGADGRDAAGQAAEQIVKDGDGTAKKAVSG